MSEVERHEDPNMFALIVVSVVGVILAFAFIVALEAWYDHTQETRRMGKSADQSLNAYADTISREADELTRYGWVDRDKGVVRIPIERAMDLVVQDLSTQPTADSGSR